MGNRKKLKRALLSGKIPIEASMDDVQALYEEAGWELDRITGSHHQFTKLNRRTEVVAAHGGTIQQAVLRKLAAALKEAEGE